MFIVALIPARGGSKEIKNKNLKKLNGKPLLEYTINEAKKSKLLDSIYISSDSDKILNFGKKRGINVVKRPKNISRDESKTIDAIKHFIKKTFKKKVVPDLLVILQPTSPLRKSFHIDEAIKKILSIKSANSLVSCVEVPHNFTPDLLMKIKNDGFLKIKKLLRRQNKKLFYARNGAAIYIIRKPTFYKSIFGKKILPYMMDALSSIDINNFEDLKFARLIIKSNYEK